MCYYWAQDYDFEKIEVTVGNKIVNVQLWDTAGMEEHRYNSSTLVDVIPAVINTFM